MHLRAADRLPPQFNAAQWFIGRHMADGRARRTAIIDGEGSITYGELDEAVRRFAGVLRDAGIRGDERVAFIAPDSRWLSIGFWGAIAAGAVAVPINTLLTASDFRNVLEDCGGSYLCLIPILPPQFSLPTSWTASISFQPGTTLVASVIFTRSVL